MSASTSADKYVQQDIERGPTLVPGMTREDNMLRWGFIRKVYGILFTQLLLTALVITAVIVSHPLHSFILRTPWFLIPFAFLPFILLCPLYCYRQSHPINLVLLGLFTISISFIVGISCAFTKASIVLEAFVLTATMVLGLTIYTFWATKRGQDFSFLGPILFAALLTLIVFGLIQAIFRASRVVATIYAVVGTLIFSAYIVYDTGNLITRFGYDEYIWASVSLYLDILNLFLYLLQLLSDLQSN